MHQDPPHLGHTESSIGTGPFDYLPYHQMYMDHFDDNHHDYTSLHITVQSVSTHVDALTTNFQGLNTHFGEFVTNYNTSDNGMPNAFMTSSGISKRYATRPITTPDISRPLASKSSIPSPSIEDDA